MKLRKTGHSWTVNSAPLEFVLIGPRLEAPNDPGAKATAERDGVLIRTGNLKPDLLALAIESREEIPGLINHLIRRANRRRSPFDFLSILLGLPGAYSNRLRRLNAVRSEMTKSKSGRSSNYVFAWAGKVEE